MSLKIGMMTKHEEGLMRNVLGEKSRVLTISHDLGTLTAVLQARDITGLRWPVRALRAITGRGASRSYRSTFDSER